MLHVIDSDRNQKLKRKQKIKTKKFVVETNFCSIAVLLKKGA